MGREGIESLRLMIQLVCTKCSTVLTVDDGFAGGVCRCSTCGTIQTVPRKNEVAAKSGAKTTVIYERSSAAEAVNKDLESLGEVVTSSGIAGSGVLYQSARRKPKSGLPGLWIGAVLGAVVALGGSWLLLRGSDPSADHAKPVVPAPNGTQATPTRGAHFGSIALDRTGTVVYLIDRGDATRAYTAQIASAVARSLATLPTTRRFQVRYWWSEGESPAYPLTPGEPSEYNRGKVSTWMNDVAGGQSTDALASLDAALTAKPTEIVLITGKAWQIDDSITSAAVAKLAGNPVRIHVVSVGAKLEDDPLARLASKTAGTYLALSGDELGELSR